MSALLPAVSAPVVPDDQLDEALAQQEFVFREVTEVGEVEALLALRHRVYDQTEAMRGFLADDGPPLLVDSYDRFAKLFGLFVRASGHSSLIGTLRVVTMDPGPAGLALQMVAAPYPALVQRLRSPRRKPIPFLEMCPGQGVIESLVNRAIARGEGVVEAGRFALDPEFRAGRGTQLGLARHMIEITMAHFFLPKGYDRAFIDCVPAHARLYERVGFRPIGQGERILAPGSGADLVALEITRDDVVGEVRERVLARAAELAATGRVVLTSGPGGTVHPRFEAGTPYSLPYVSHRAGTVAIAHRALHIAGAC